MKKALISEIEPRTHFDGSAGYRVAQVEDDANVFAVADGLYWLDCADDVVADQYYFDTAVNEIKPIPVPPPPPPPEPKPQPTTQGLTEV